MINTYFWISRLVACGVIILGCSLLSNTPNNDYISHAPRKIILKRPPLSQSVLLIKNKICNHTSFSCDGINVKVIPSKHINAYSEDSTVNITTALIENLQSESELAFVLAHEMAHIFSDHSAEFPENLILTDSQLQRINSVRKTWEFDADNEAIRTLSKAGYDLWAGSKLLRRLEKKDSSGVFHSHPPIGARLEAMRVDAYILLSQDSKSPQFLS